MRPSFTLLTFAIVLAGASLNRAADAATNSTPKFPRTDANGKPSRRGHQR